MLALTKLEFNSNNILFLNESCTINWPCLSLCLLLWVDAKTSVQLVLMVQAVQRHVPARTMASATTLTECVCVSPGTRGRSAMSDCVLKGTTASGVTGSVRALPRTHKGKHLTLQHLILKLSLLRVLSLLWWPHTVCLTCVWLLHLQQCFPVALLWFILSQEWFSTGPKMTETWKQLCVGLLIWKIYLLTVTTTVSVGVTAHTTTNVQQNPA